MLKSGMAAADVVAEIAPDLTAPAVDAGGPARASTWAPVDLTAILDGTHTTPEPCLMIRNDGVGLLYAGLTHSFHGESESGKSLIAQAEAARVLNAGGRVLFLDFESDPVSVVGRMVEMGADPAALAPAAGRFAYLQPEADFRNGYDLAAFDAVLSEPADLAIVDGVTASLGLFGMSTKDNDDVTAWARLLSDRIARKTGAAVVAIDHVTKDSESRGRFAIGGQAKLSALTGSGYVVEVVEPLGRGLRGVVTVRVAKDRPGFIRARSGPFRAKDRTQEAARFIVDSTGPDTVVTIEAPRGDVTHPETFRPTTLMEKISEHLEVTGTPQSFRSLDKCVSGKADSKRDALALLVAEGFVTVSPGPRNSNMHTLARPYRQADDPQSDRFSGGTHSPGVTVPFSDRDRVPPYRPGHGDTVNDRVPDTVGTQSGHGHTVCRLHPSIPAVAGACVTCDQIAERSLSLIHI